MGRPNKFDLSYFPLEVGFFDDHKVISIEETAGIKGGYIALRLMAMVYADKGYYLEWPDKFESTAAKRIGNGVTGASVAEIFKLCLKYELFNKEVFEQNGIVTSTGIQRRWLKVMNDIRRKIEVNPNYWIISSEGITFSSEVKRVSSEETTVPAAESTQKEIKEKEIKKKNVAPDKPSPPKIYLTAPPEEKEPYWQALVKAWFDFNEKNFQEKPSFKDRDPKFFKKIIELLKKRAGTKKIEWTENNAVASLNYFLGIAFEDSWIAKNFLLENLLKQFDKVYMQQNKKAGGAKASEPVDVITQVEIDYLVGRHIEGAMLFSQVKPCHYEFLHNTGLCSITEAAMVEARRMRIDDFLGTNNGEKLRLINAYQDNKETTETKQDLPNLLNTAKRVAAFFYIDNCKAEALKSIAS